MPDAARRYGMRKATIAATKPSRSNAELDERLRALELDKAKYSRKRSELWAIVGWLVPAINEIAKSTGTALPPAPGYREEDGD